MFAFQGLESWKTLQIDQKSLAVKGFWLYAYSKALSMTFELVFKRSLLSPSFIQYGDDEPRPVEKAHIVGKRKVQDIPGKKNPGGKNDNDPKPGKYDARGIRRLETISPGEVKLAYQSYEKQLTQTSYRSFIASNHFYMIDLAERESVPAIIFGRINLCLPGDGPIQNIREMELSFPQKEKSPDQLVLHPRDILLNGNVRSYGVRVKFLCTKKDKADFAGFENAFLEAGFVLEYQDGYLDLLEMKESNKASLPLFHVIGSRWFASVPPTVQEEVRSGLRKLIEWDSPILNYHPDHMPSDVQTLNRELGFQYGYTKFVLIESRDAGQVLQIIKPTFEKLFSQPIK